MRPRGFRPQSSPDRDPAGCPGPNTVVDLAPLSDDELSDDELGAVALAADPDAPLDDDAVCLSDVIEPHAPRLLPEWYMPTPMAGAAPLRGWRRRVVGLVIAAFLVITAYGLCNTYGQLHGG